MYGITLVNTKFLKEIFKLSNKTDFLLPWNTEYISLVKKDKTTYLNM